MEWSALSPGHILREEEWKKSTEGWVGVLQRPKNGTNQHTPHPFLPWFLFLIVLLVWTLSLNVLNLIYGWCVLCFWDLFVLFISLFYCLLSSLLSLVTFRCWLFHCFHCYHLLHLVIILFILVFILCGANVQKNKASHQLKTKIRKYDEVEPYCQLDVFTWQWVHVCLPV